MKRITKIEKATPLGFKRRTRVAAYCRVSTIRGEQLVSLETQKSHYENFIKSNDEWEYAGLYFDEGITGTKKEKRAGLMDLMKACEDGRIDFVITKSISRFARNTTDCLEMIRRLQEIQIPILFEKENINTGTMDSELMLSVLSSMAEHESVSISENGRWSVKRRFNNGTYIISIPPYGYANEDGKMVIVPKQAEVIQRIFKEALSGKGTRAIARGLNDSGISSMRGGKWQGSTITGILKNEKYIGDALFQKTFTDSRFNRHRNAGELNQYLVTDHHEGIISREDYEKVQTMIAHHGKEKGIECGTDKYQKRYVFSGKIKCGECGTVFKRRMHFKPSGPYVAWCCSKHIEDKSSCAMKYIKDEAIKAAFVRMMAKLESTQKQILKPLVHTLGKTNETQILLQLNGLDALIQKNDEQHQILVGLMKSGVLEQVVFDKESNALMHEANNLRAEKEQLVGGNGGYMKQEEQARKLLKYLSRGESPQDFDETAFLDFVSEITAVSREQIVFSLKCGLKLAERLVD